MITTPLRLRIREDILARKCKIFRDLGEPKMIHHFSHTDFK